MVAKSKPKNRDQDTTRRARPLEAITAIGSVTTPILVLLLSGIGWLAKDELQRQDDLEDMLRADRIETYNQILEPFVILLMTDAAWQSDPLNKGRDREALASQILLSTEYRKQGFKLVLFGSDSVVAAYGDLMQYSFQLDASKKASAKEGRGLVELLGSLLLEIRKDTGNETTQLDRWQMLEWFVTDARQYRASSS